TCRRCSFEWTPIIDRVAESPAADAPATLRVHAVQAIEALAARRDGADDDTLPDRVVRLQSGAEFIDHADRLVAEDQARLDRVFATDDVHIRAADGRRRDADDGFAGARRRLLNLFDRQPVSSLEYDGLHR